MPTPLLTDGEKSKAYVLACQSRITGDAPPRGICGSGMIDLIDELLKTDIDRSKFAYPGNSSVVGAHMALLSTDYRQEARRICIRLLVRLIVIPAAIWAFGSNQPANASSCDMGTG